MNHDDRHAGNVVLLRGGALWLIVALILAWCLVTSKPQVPVVINLFQDFDRLLQAHIDFLLMTALIFGIYAAKVPLPWHVRWAIVVGAFTNSSLFLLMSVFPILNGPPQPGLGPAAFKLFTMASITVTTYGFGVACVILFRSTFDRPSSA
jgi:hypothetical protein